MAARRPPRPHTVGRKLTAPVRNYVNTHIADLKTEIRLARDALALGGADVQYQRQLLAASIDRVRETIDLVGLQTARLTGLHDELLGRGAPLASPSDDLRLAWVAFVGRSLDQLEPGAVVGLDSDDRGLAAALAALGYVASIEPGAGATTQCDALVVLGDVPSGEAGRDQQVLIWWTTVDDWRSRLAGTDAPWDVDKVATVGVATFVSATRR